jgi:5-methylcytosine-specific restriction endonuclease McrA
VKPVRVRLSKQDRARIIARDLGICWLCGKRGADTVDHRKPMSHGGTNLDGNLFAAHKTCNSKRGAPHPVEGRYLA